LQLDIHRLASDGLDAPRRVLFHASGCSP